ncbi:MAG: nucleotide sugar dehydrogenase [Phycisphaerales bacterium]
MTDTSHIPSIPSDSSDSDGQHSVEQELMQKINDRSAVVGVVGLGYVGLPLVQAVHSAGYRVIGFDVDAPKIEMLNQGRSYLKHLGDELTQTLAASDRFTPSNDEAVLEQADIVILCVPTPINASRDPDLSFVIGSTQTVGRSLRSGQLVILESTTYPGTTRDVMLPILQDHAKERGLDLQPGVEYFVAYSPEREDPGRAGMVTSMIPKIVGGLDEASGSLAQAFYSSCIEHVFRVGSCEIGEASKLLENVYRAVNIALVNELKVVFDRMDIDIWEVIDAAKTKPFGFEAFYPGPGLGGHCIPIDPFYLAWKAKQVGHETRFVELAGEINRRMPSYVVERVEQSLAADGKTLDGASVLLVGIAYKPDVDDIREAPAAEIITLLNDAGAQVSYHDPLISEFPSMRRYTIELNSVELDQGTLGSADCVLIVTDHQQIDWDLIGQSSSLVVDTRNAMARARDQKENTGDWIARVVKA